MLITNIKRVQSLEYLGAADWQLTQIQKNNVSTILSYVDPQHFFGQKMKRSSAFSLIVSLS